MQAASSKCHKVQQPNVDKMLTRSTQTRAVAQGQANHSESGDLIPDTVLSPLTSTCSRKKNTRVGRAGAEVSVHGNRGVQDFGVEGAKTILE